MHVTIFGLGYVGSVTAACLADAGHVVTGVDPVAGKVDAILAGRPPVAEPGLAELMERGRAAGRLHATTDVAASLVDVDVALICVGTPSAVNGSLDTRFVQQVADQIQAFVAAQDPGHALVVAFRSTMLPGTTARIVAEHLPAALPGSDRPGVHFAFMPEFLRESTAIHDFANPPFSVIGTDAEPAYITLSEMLQVVRAPLRLVSVETAEALKYACNAFHAVKVTFANEMGRFCDSVGLDGTAMMQLFTEDDVLNVSPRYLRPGFAFGGSCLPKDVRAITNHARMHDVELPLITSLLHSNTVAVDRAVAHVLEQGWREVALLGLTFKSGTDDLRESPFVELAERLLSKGVNLRIHDPNIVPEQVIGSNLQYVETRLPHLWRLLTSGVEQAVDGADVVLIGSEARPEVLDALPAAVPALHVSRSATTWPQAAAAPVGA